MSCTEESIIQDVQGALAATNYRQVVILEKNPIATISRVLAQQSQLSAIHIISHGQSGEIQLGQEILNQDTLVHYQPQIEQWHKSFKATGRILLYGCQVAKGEKGRQFVESLQQKAQLNISASTNLTGAKNKNGDWRLEYVLGAKGDNNEVSSLHSPHFTGLLWTTSAFSAAWWEDVPPITSATLAAPTVGFSAAGDMTVGSAALTMSAPSYSGTTVFQSDAVNSTSFASAQTNNEYLYSVLTVDPALTQGVRIDRFRYNQVTVGSNPANARMTVALYDPTGAGTLTTIASNLVVSGSTTGIIVPAASMPVLVPGVAYQLRFYVYGNGAIPTGKRVIYDNPALYAQISQKMTLRKTWVNAQLNNAVNVTATGLSSFASIANTANETDTASVQEVSTGSAITLGETFTTGSASNYTSSLACTGNATALAGSVLTVNNADRAIVCTYTNTRKSATLRLAKAWGANSISGNVANIGATTGLLNNTSAFTSTASTANNSNTVTVYAGETVTLPAETMSTGTLANYTTSLSCDNGVTPSGSNGQSSNTVSIPNTFSGLITCTYTNTRKSATLRIAKAWGANSITGNVANIGVTTGLTNNTSALTSTASTNTNGTAVTVFAGETVTLPAETMSTGTLSNYNTLLSCTADAGATANSLSGTNGQSSNTLTIGAGDEGKVVTCTYTNTGLSDMVPSLTYMPNTGIVGSPYYGKFSCTNSGIAPATAGATCAITLPAGLSATCSPTVPTASTVAVNATISCTVTGTPTTAVSDTLVLTTGATNDSNGGTTNGGNNQVTQAITITDPTATAMCSSGSATNLLSAAGTEVYYDTNTNTPITNSFGLIASPTTYVRTGSNFVVKGNWRWRNADPASGSPAMTYQLIVNGTVYAQLVGTPSGQEVGTLTALNGATLDGGLSTMQIYDFSVSGLAVLFVSVTLPSTVTTISTLSMSFVSSTTHADDAGLAPTLLNACALPKLTITKVSNGGVGSFAFTGDNGFTNETITTTVAGTGVVGTTQTLSAVSTTTIISETIPSGYTVTDISCTGLGSGSATPNLATGTVTLSDTAVVYGANLACTFTNTATITNYILSGKVFLDNGKNAATPHNGLQEVDELGLGNITMTLTDCASTTYQTVLTDGAGAYSFNIPNSLTTGSTLCVEEHQPSTLVSVTGVVGTTSGTYSLASDRTQFTLTINTNYTGVNFGDVAESQLTGTGSQTISAGTTANYIHQFIAGTEGAVTLTTAQAPSPSLSGWTSIMYLDATCDAQLNAGDTQITASFSVIADQVVCLIQKVQSPVTATNGAMDVSTVSASFAFTAPSVIVRPYSQTDTTIVMDSSLVLVKRLRQVSSCPSTGADVNPFITNNQALPNEFIEYQILYSNPSAATLSNITVHDVTPAFTEFRSASCTTTPSSLLCATPSSGSGTAPNIGGVGDIDWILTNNPTGLSAGQSGEVRFCVRITP